MIKPQFYRTSILLDEDRLEKLSNSHVVIAGVGGVGGQVVESLSRAGIGKLTIIDNDIVDITNINRQIIATLSTVGKDKVDLFKQRILDINPECTVNAKKIFIDKNSIPDLLKEKIDYVVDCIDTISSKVDLIYFCINNKINIISSMGAGNRLDTTKIKISDISKTKYCGLARLLRTKLKKIGISKGLMVVYSEEVGTKPLIKKENIRPINGTISYMPSLFGLHLSGNVINNLLKNKTE